MTAAENAAIPDLDQLFSDLAHPNPFIQARAFEAMAKSWKVQAIPRLVDLLDQPDMGLRRAAVRALGHFGAEAMQPIADCFQAHADSTVRASCVKAYAYMVSDHPGLHFSEAAMGMLRSAGADPHPNVAVVAVMAMGQVGRQAVPLLMEILAGDNPAQGVAAVNALAAIDDPSVEAKLQDLNDHPSTDRYVRETVASALIRIKDLKTRQPA